MAATLQGLQRKQRVANFNTIHVSLVFFKPQTTTSFGLYLRAGILECGNAHHQPIRDLQAPSAKNTHKKHKQIPDN